MRQHPKSKFWFFASAIAEHFEFRPDWYRQGAVAALVLEYYWLLRSVLRAKPDLRACLTRCRIRQIDHAVAWLKKQPP